METGRLAKRLHLNFHVWDVSSNFLLGEGEGVEEGVGKSRKTVVFRKQLHGG